jgi:hypothetical protein
MVEGPIQPVMVSLPLFAWLSIGGVAFAGLLAVLYTLAETIRCETYTHDVKTRANKLRLQYAAQLRGEQGHDVIIVDEAPPAEDSLRRAA